MCERCTIIESAFGLRDPLPPRVASLDAEATITYAKDEDDQSLAVENGSDLSVSVENGSYLSLRVRDEFKRVPRTVHDAGFDQLRVPDGVKPVWQPPASTLSGIRDSPLAPHR